MKTAKWSPSLLGGRRGAAARHRYGLGMEDESRVTHAIGRVKRHGPPELELLKSGLEQVYESNSGKVEV
jgi:hypothetical protein